jgi:hypothetical protein
VVVLAVTVVCVLLARETSHVDIAAEDAAYRARSGSRADAVVD